MDGATFKHMEFEALVLKCLPGTFLVGFANPTGFTADAPGLLQLVKRFVGPVLQDDDSDELPAGQLVALETDAARRRTIRWRSSFPHRG
jgi:hypothetical protein